MKTKGKTLIAFIDKSGRLDETQLQQDLDNIKEFYQNKGYIDVGSRKTFCEERQERAHRHKIAINEGPLYHAGKVTFTGYKADHRGKVSRGHQNERGENLFVPKACTMTPRALLDAYGIGGYVDLWSCRKARRPAQM